jgi:cytochrome c oxidase subunit 2
MSGFFYELFLFVILFISVSTNANEAKKDYLIDGAHENAVFFQEPASEIMHEIINLHSIIFTVMMIIFVLCCSLLLYILFRFSEKRNQKPQTFTHNTTLEVLWTGIPLLIVCVMAFYNIGVLKKEEAQEYHDMDMTIKVVGHQWYWTYEYPDQGLKFDSYMKKDEDLSGDDKRLLSVDNPVYVPVGKKIKLIIAADDVIHSWALPAFGVKKDAVPGRLNETWFQVDKEGVFYGQCSELCGLLHGFMPIEVRALSEDAFKRWAEEAKTKFSA